MNELTNMGGYGVFVWSAYFITLLVFALNIFLTFFENRQVKKIFKKYLTLTKNQYEP